MLRYLLAAAPSSNSLAADNRHAVNWAIAAESPLHPGSSLYWVLAVLCLIGGAAAVWTRSEKKPVSAPRERLRIVRIFVLFAAAVCFVVLALL